MQRKYQSQQNGLFLEPSMEQRQGLRKLWLRGGFRHSYLAGNDRESFEWWQDVIRTILERDIPQRCLMRVLETYHSNLKERLVKSPKLYLRASGESIV